MGVRARGRPNNPRPAAIGGRKCKSFVHNSRIRRVIDKVRAAHRQRHRGLHRLNLHRRIRAGRSILHAVAANHETAKHPARAVREVNERALRARVRLIDLARKQHIRLGFGVNLFQRICRIRSIHRRHLPNVPFRRDWQRALHGSRFRNQPAVTVHCNFLRHICRRAVWVHD